MSFFFFLVLLLLPLFQMKRGHLGGRSKADSLRYSGSLNSHGYPIGIKLLDLLIARAPASSAQRPIRILPLLQFITTTLWRHLFGRAADALERAANNPAEYMVTDNEPLVNSYVSMPREMSQLNCAAFVAGIIEGVCDASGFSTISVTAHSVREQEKASEGSSGGGGGGDAAATAAGVGMWPGKTIFLIKFKPEVLEREEILGRET